ncbi:ROK family protein [Roseateles violae]|uniref:ROK family protein n=1 Tax=Roseateles violae TaxID=3058042 RepID=A0ABT8DQT8_9BURK|nr:ROK family protein [Pelomonas sp. PFR6]MDN3920328.1 ROK family protein [Pelomonas sp. PFR6]
MKSNYCALALDVGGTKILAAAIGADGELLGEAERPTEAARGGAAVLDAMRAALADLPAGLPTVRGLGISAAGVIDPDTARVVDATDAMPGWAGTDLRAAFPGMAVHALNDVHAALLGELAWGALRERPLANAVMLTLGTGLGGALAIGGRVHTGKGHIAGHFGRARLQHGGRWRSVESLVSGTGLANLYRELGGELPPEAGARAVLQEPLDAIAEAALAIWVEQLAAQIHNIRWTLDPECVLIGGGMLDAKSRWWPQLQAAVQGVTLLPAALGKRAGVFGAARHLFDQLEAGT